MGTTIFIFDFERKNQKLELFFRIHVYQLEFEIQLGFLPLFLFISNQIISSVKLKYRLTIDA